MSVKRYEPNVYEVLGGQYECEMSEDDRGDYVLYSDYAALLARHNALREAVDNLRDHNQYLEICLDDRNTEMMRHVSMYETLREAVAWERECEAFGWQLVRECILPRSAAVEVQASLRLAQSEVDRLLGEK